MQHLLIISIPRARNIGSHFSVGVSAANSEIETNAPAFLSKSTSDESNRDVSATPGVLSEQAVLATQVAEQTLCDQEQIQEEKKPMQNANKQARDAPDIRPNRPGTFIAGVLSLPTFSASSFNFVSWLPPF